MSHRHMPEVSVANQDEVQAHFLENPPSVPMMWFAHSVLATAFRPDSIYEAGARQGIRDHASTGRPFLLALKHSKYYDPLEAAAEVLINPDFRKYIGKFSIPAQAPIFNKPFLHWFIPRAGGAPVFRSEDLINTEDMVRFDEQGNETQEFREARKAANRKAIDVVISRINTGGSAAIMPEGSRRDKSKEERRVASPKPKGPIGLIKALKYLIEKDIHEPPATRVRKLKPGIADIALGVDRPQDLRIVCISAYYGRPANIRRPSMAISRPMEIAATEEDILDGVKDSLQKMLNLAIDLHDSKQR